MKFGLVIPIYGAVVKHILMINPLSNRPSTISWLNDDAEENMAYILDSLQDPEILN